MGRNYAVRQHATEEPLPPVNGDRLNLLVLLAFAFATLCVLAGDLLIDHWPTVGGAEIYPVIKDRRGSQWQRAIFDREGFTAHPFRSVKIQEILRGWLHRLPRRWPYAFGFQNCLNKLGFRIAVGITITLVLIGQIRFQSRISRPSLHVSPQHIPEHDQGSKTRMIVLDYL
jgi:hypothetical protein